MTNRVRPAPSVGAVLASLQSDEGPPEPTPVEAVKKATPDLTLAPAVAPEPEPMPAPAVASEPELTPAPAVASEPELTPAPAVASEPELTPAPAVIAVPTVESVEPKPAGVEIPSADWAARPTLDGLSTQVVADLLASAAGEAQRILDRAVAEREAILAQARAQADAYLTAQVQRLTALRDGLSDVIGELNASGET